MDVVPTTEGEHHDEGDPKVEFFRKNPDHHGFSDDPVEDWQNAHAVLFTSISLTLVFGTLYFRYSPDFRNCNWARREAERLVKQREAAGLPLLSQDVYDRNSIILPLPGEDEAWKQEHLTHH